MPIDKKELDDADQRHYRLEKSRGQIGILERHLIFFLKKSDSK